ncbi:MAG TPA: ABC transporter permease [Dissulfurispiraceae bacterium]|nr:ABC transporter permease [Dissulfurispiraceae bacterium]
MTKAGKIYLLVVLFLFAISIAAPLLPLPDPNRIDLDSLQLSPDAQHPFGTDHKGRDILSRVIHGARITISVALVAALVSACVGSVVGLAAGYFGGRTDTLLMALVDFILSFPSLLLAIAVSVVMPPGIHTAMIALSASGWTSFARLIRGQVLSIKELPFVDAARAMGCSSARTLFVHIAPQCLTVGLVMMGMKLGGFVIAEATLGFLGLGVQPPAPSWGAMISASRAYILTAPWTIFFPGLMIAVTAFCFNLFAEQLRKKYDVGRIGG